MGSSSATCFLIVIGILLIDGCGASRARVADEAATVVKTLGYSDPFDAVARSLSDSSRGRVRIDTRVLKNEREAVTLASLEASTEPSIREMRSRTLRAAGIKEVSIRDLLPCPGRFTPPDSGVSLSGCPAEPELVAVVGLGRPVRGNTDSADGASSQKSDALVVRVILQLRRRDGATTEAFDYRVERAGAVWRVVSRTGLQITE